MLSWLVFFVSFLNYTELEFPIYAWLSYTAEPHFQYNIKSVLKIQASLWTQYDALAAVMSEENPYNQRTTKRSSSM